MIPFANARQRKKYQTIIQPSAPGGRWLDYCLIFLSLSTFPFSAKYLVRSQKTLEDSNAIQGRQFIETVVGWRTLRGTLPALCTCTLRLYLSPSLFARRC